MTNVYKISQKYALTCIHQQCKIFSLISSKFNATYDNFRRTGGTNFSSEDIVIADTTDTSCGVEVDFYARVGNGAGIVPRNALEQSTRVCKDQSA